MTTNTHSSPSGGKELPAGTQLEEFVIERVLGSGGFGITYLARDTRLDRKVVIKENLPNQFAFRDTTSLLVKPGSAREDLENFRWSMENFSREAAILAALDHPGIVKVLRSFEAYGTAYFAMPFIEGRTLDEIAREHQELGRDFPESELRGFLERVLEALGHLHGHGIYHRDIKPANILISSIGLPVLIDFGSARQRISERSMTVVESGGYTPLEQLQSRGSVGPWSDIYSLGATLLKIMTGCSPPLPADRIGDDPVDALLRDSKIVENYSQGFLQGLRHSLGVHHTERWQSTGEWLAFLREGSVPGGFAVTGNDAQEVPTTKAKPSSRKPVLVAALACLLLGGASITTMWFIRNRGALSTSGATEETTAPATSSQSAASGEAKLPTETAAPEPAPASPPEIIIEPRLATAFEKLEGLMNEGQLAAAASLIDGLKQLEMNPAEENAFAKIRLRFADLAASATMEVHGAVAPENVEIRVDGMLVTGSLPIPVKGYGDHSLAISRDGYEPYETKIRVDASSGRHELGEVMLRKRPGEPAPIPPAATAGSPPADSLTVDADPDVSREPDRDTLGEEIQSVLKDWINANGGNDLNAYGVLLDARVDYEYVKGRLATRAEVLKDFEKNITRWPIRSYKVRDNKFTWADLGDGDRARIGFSLDYHYSDHSGRQAKGITQIELHVRRVDGRWVISRFSETVQRTRNDKKGI